MYVDLYRRIERDAWDISGMVKLKEPIEKSEYPTCSLEQARISILPSHLSIDTRENENERGSFCQVIGSSNAITNLDQYHTFKWIRRWRGSCVTFEDRSILWPTIRRHDTNRDLLSKQEEEEKEDWQINWLDLAGDRANSDFTSDMSRVHTGAGRFIDFLLHLCVCFPSALRAPDVSVC